jgi:hypothetical protein
LQQLEKTEKTLPAWSNVSRENTRRTNHQTCSSPAACSAYIRHRVVERQQ